MSTFRMLQAAANANPGWTEVNLTYSAGWDTNDLVAYMGTNGLTVAFANPMSTVRWGHMHAKYLGTSPGTNARLAFDRGSSRWHAPGTVTDQHMLWDLGAKRTMAPNVLGIRSQVDAASYPRHWKFQGSNDGGVTWTDLYTSTTVAHTAQGQWRTFDIVGSAFYQLLRLVQTGVNSIGTSNFITDDLQIWGKLRTYDLSKLTYPPPDTPFGANGAVRALAPTMVGDSVFNSNAASRASDGSTSTYFHSNNSSTGWLRMQFGGGVKIIPYEIHLRCRHDSSSSVFGSAVLEGSDNASTWTTLATYPTGIYNDAITGLQIRLSVPPPAVGYTYLRLRATSEFLIVSEIDVFGKVA